MGRTRKSWWSLGLALLVAGCSGTVGGLEDQGVGLPDMSQADAPARDQPLAADRAVEDGGAADGATPDVAAGDQGAPPAPPQPIDPCAAGSCWSAPALGSACGSSTVSQDYSSGTYNVHRYPLMAPAGVTLDVSATVKSGSWSPALIVHGSGGATLYDGEHGLVNAAFTVQPIDSGRGKTSASFRLTAQADSALSIFVSGWSVVDGGFSPFLPTAAKYDVTVVANCKPPPPGALQSPPNFDPSNQDAQGYYLLPPSSPAGLYTRKADDCSRGTKLLIDVLYTVAAQWKLKRPALSPISMLDLNEGSCSSVNHATHDDGTHADLTAGCATQVACTDNQPAIELAKLFVDTGQVCGIINNDPGVQAVVNAYFSAKYSYTPWHNTFMRSVSGHTHHFHVRVKKPDGSCN